MVSPLSMSQANTHGSLWALEEMELGVMPDPIDGVDKPFRLRNDWLFTPTLQGALGFRYAELAFTLPVHINAGAHDPRYQSPSGDRNFNNSLSYAAQGVGDLGIHVKGRLLNVVVR